MSIKLYKKTIAKSQLIIYSARTSNSTGKTQNSVFSWTLKKRCKTRMKATEIHSLSCEKPALGYVLPLTVELEDSAFLWFPYHLFSSFFLKNNKKPPIKCTYQILLYPLCPLYLSRMYMFNFYLKVFSCNNLLYCFHSPSFS